ncbi:MAG: AzlD domain-containing protein [Spirochaetales bacterium]|nr:AzlD domain-containing protein [Spirochaetales bacterium]
MTTVEIIMLFGMFAVTFSIRYILLAAADRFQMPELMERALYYVPPAVLTAILVPAVLLPQGVWELTLSNAYIFGALAAVAGGVILRKHTLMASIVSGLAVFFIWRFLFS